MFCAVWRKRRHAAAACRADARAPRRRAAAGTALRDGRPARTGLRSCALLLCANSVVLHVVWSVQVRQEDRQRFDTMTQRTRDLTLRAIVDYLGE